jgi:hypothetical protein
LRTKVVGNLTRCSNRMVKELETSGIKLASVCSDPLGTSACAMLAALLEGTPTIDPIVDLAPGRLRAKIPELKRALVGAFTEATRLNLQQLLQDLSYIERNLKTLDDPIAQRFAPYQRQVDLRLTIPGFDRVAIASVLAEIGPDMSVFEKVDRLAAWGGVCPGSNESAGKAKQAPTRKGDKSLRTILVQAAQAGKNTRNSYWRAETQSDPPRAKTVKSPMATQKTTDTAVSKRSGRTLLTTSAATIIASMTTGHRWAARMGAVFSSSSASRYCSVSRDRGSPGVMDRTGRYPRAQV